MNRFFTSACCGLVLAVSAAGTLPSAALADETTTKPAAPRIVNIVNFIRLLEPRSEQITEDVLFETVVKQAELMQQLNLPGTFLLQYDALTDSRYQEFLKSLPPEQFEIGAWWELPQPLVEKAGLTWRGRYPWDWHANVGFVSGYTPAERERLADAYMADFNKIFGRYPKSVASWFIDAHTLQYLHDKYGIVASANCKDQVGTDGYTLWGGYWNQAYYPSRVNAYMPAQTADAQIPVPVFRMLGSDPLRQYDTGVGSNLQGVTSLEPVYGDSGGDPEWVEWFFHNLVEGQCLAFNYTQAGQENSFTWAAMRRGLEFQFPLIARLRDNGQLRVETLAESGAWFRREFPVTPATAMTFQSPLKGDNRQTVWFNSRFYRTNLIWENGTMRVRDIHLFDQTVESPILKQSIDQPAVEFYTLPLVDGYLWSSRDTLAGLQLLVDEDGQTRQVTGGDPLVTRGAAGQLDIAWPTTDPPGQFLISLTEDEMQIAFRGAGDPLWRLKLVTAMPPKFTAFDVSESAITGNFRGTKFRVDAQQGRFETVDRGFRILPDKGAIALKFDQQTKSRAAGK
ncbi:MAG: hypothetical protein CMJ58_06800 [Planctomycetaceae bacterium]|nr:hypothetical protein [Planctomycetaceae bacterium]